MEMDNEINAVSMSAPITPILQPTGQGVVSTFKSGHLRNTLHKVIAPLVILLMALSKVN